MGIDAQEQVSGAATLSELACTCGRRGEAIALSQLRELAIGADRPEGREVSYEGLQGTAIAIAKGLIALGVEKGEPIALLASTRAEWTIFELGAMCAGAALVPIYHTSSAQECAYVLQHSRSTLVLCEDEGQRAKIAAVRGNCPDLRHVLTLWPGPGEAGAAEPLSGRGEVPAPAEANAPETPSWPREAEAAPPLPLLGQATSLRRLIELGSHLSDEDVFQRVSQVRPQDVATIVYTSGTTGPPKGCVLTHSNLVETTRMYRERLFLGGDTLIYMFLPLAHVLARVAQAVVLDVGGTLVFWSGDPNKIVQEASEAQATHFVAVPRVYEKVHNAVIDSVEGKGPIARALFAWAVEVGRRARPKGRAARRAKWLSNARLGLAERIALKAVRELFGPRLQFALVGAAPADASLLQFFDACGVLVLEGYGMTESCAAATLNPLQAPKFGTVGTALPGTEIAVAKDGEILLSGPHVFQGYHRNPQATAETVVDGWLHTGDLGFIDEHGYLTVTGRKKDLIVTSSGKNIGPAEIENGLRESRWISEAVVYGDRRPYLVAMLTLDRDELPTLAHRLGIERIEMEALANDSRVHEALWEHVSENNARFARIEQIKRFGVLPHELTLEAGELTPTLKVKRSIVYSKYASFFDRLYLRPDGRPASGDGQAPNPEGQSGVQGGQAASSEGEPASPRGQEETKR